MGLDNIPVIYPCKKAGTDIVDSEGRIDCDKTQESGGCPHLNERNADPLLKDAIAVTGIFGTDCWYRGKYGNYLLQEMSNHDSNFPAYESFSFYGNGIDETTEGISPDECLEMAYVMEEFIESWVKYVKTQSDVAGNPEEEKRLIDDWIYASWWLKFTAKFGNGSQVWY